MHFSTFPLCSRRHVSSAFVRVAAFSLVMLFTGQLLYAAPAITLERHAPCNLFEPGTPVILQAELKGFPAGTGEVHAVATDYSSKEVLRKAIPYKAQGGGGTELPVDLGMLSRGYYEVRMTQDPAQLPKEPTASLGIMEFAQRSAAEVREGGYVFGLKWWDGVKNKDENMQAMVNLGLQWTRVIQNQKGPLTTERMLKEFPMNAVIKVERFPKDLYDEERYGPMAEWEVKYGRGAWVIKTLPKKEPYKVWLRDQLAKLPPEQNVFEIWNEPWDKMSPEAFSEISQLILEVISQDRPDAIVGPNLVGDYSDFGYDARVIAAGGMKGMKMVALHPYGNSENREWLRKYQEWLKSKLGHAVDIHITEYGSHSTPEGPARRSEEDQARRVVRQSLALYAEGVKSLVPHWLGQTEKNPTYVEDWFGFVRLNEQPKPALLALANAARVIDSHKYLGDLWHGPRTESMLFEKNGLHTLVLWTLGEPQEKFEDVKRDVEVEVGVPSLELVEIDGRSRKITAEAGKVKLTLTEEPIYLVGVSPDLAAQATRELRPDRWPNPERPARTTRTASRMKAAPQMDGKFGDWSGAAELAMNNPKVNGADCSGTGYISWDEQFLYIGVDVRDNEVLNKQPGNKLYRQDSLELFVSTEPRDSGGGFGPKDIQFFITPTSGEGREMVAQITDREAGHLKDVEGAQYKVGPGNNGWFAEVAIPWSTFPGFEAQSGARLALEMRVNDADTSHERFKVDPVDGTVDPTDPSVWSLLILKD